MCKCKKLTYLFLPLHFGHFCIRQEAAAQKKKTKKTLNLRKNDIGKVVNAFTHKLVQKEKPTS